MIVCLMTAAANLVVGGLVGLCGVAGFLLPMFYTAGLGMNVSEGLALSFAAFIVSGALGSWNYKKAGNLDLAFGLRLSAGSLAGAILGVVLNLVIPEEQVKMLLYLVVLLSGISIRTAVGVALFNSIFIGIPAVAGYLAQCDMKKILPVLLAALAAHAVGVYYGSKNAERINQGILKKGVAVFSIVIAGCRLTGIM